ncbi:metallophosphatase domain-containing protein [Merismopedia glauca]|uniref:Metallophosphoesterase n=2 Tax=Merismopedia TaxID=53402 RepID=A0A2T1BYM1_9CYAN|nr:metallophosphatase domain-containing protein [Merismopedia glauca]PSB01111.1 metallophosphoesterase [Merismopedia glauca CCAP 1448/3]
MRIVVISDTHGKHEELGNLYGDVLIHCGDMCKAFGQELQNILDLDNWFSRQKFHRILCVGGNHDFLLEDTKNQEKINFQNAIYLQDEPYEYKGILFYGSPWVPELSGWAFYLDSENLHAKWSLIPDHVDVLITHTPPRGILDRNTAGKSCGCPNLRNRLNQVRPVLHCFGHIHASAGTEIVDGVTFYNASTVNRRYQIVREPLVFDL